ncbi:hypothetical protein CERSUDRAFT_99360 [Gelatoporia subvermispora B]|uniref:Uncharacterized protein n=1 Tax=Ceriporiopsis subvermispora (strain B) TaxID=914234 RepID=M2QKH0_CERS8|nr:hypothetical protein CERSUDRAFT_99360 [Gelatoporia subvermispora B]
MSLRRELPRQEQFPTMAHGSPPADTAAPSPSEMPPPEDTESTSLLEGSQQGPRLSISSESPHQENIKFTFPPFWTLRAP